MQDQTLPAGPAGHVHAHTIRLSVPRKLAGAVTGHDEYRECACGDRVPAPAVRAEDATPEDGRQRDASQEDGTRRDGRQEDGRQEDGRQEDGTLAGLEDAAWRDAWRIAIVGASNPAAVASALGRDTAALTRELGTAGARRHPALRAIAGHLAYLFGYGLGPEDELLDQAQRHAQRLGLAGAGGQSRAPGRSGPPCGSG